MYIMNEIANWFSDFDFSSLIDIALLFVLYWLCFSTSSKYNASYFSKVMCIVLVVASVAKMLRLVVVSYLFLMLIALTPVIFLIMFRQELKMAIRWRSVNRAIDFFHKNHYHGTEEEIRGNISLIIKSLFNVVKSSSGALIVIFPGDIPQQILASGTNLNADISSELIENIFMKDSSLGEGATIISGNKIISAGCFLPATQNPDIDKSLGARHKAAIGITEMYDVMSIAVSKETGILSTCRKGKIKRYLDRQMLENELEIIYGIRKDEEEDL